MGSIQTGIELNDNFTAVINNIINSVNLAISTMYDMQGVMDAGVDTGSLAAAKSEIDQATIAVNELEQAMSRVEEIPQVVPAGGSAPGTGMVVNVDPVVDTAKLQEEVSSTPLETHLEIQVNAPPDPVMVPVEWQADNLEVFTGTGVDRFRQEIQGANTMLEQLCSTQDAIAKRAYNANVFPPEAFQDLNAMAVKMDWIRERIQQIGNNPVNMGTDRANAELEQMRSQLDSLVQLQDQLDTAVKDMDVSAANEAYLKLSQTVSGTERYIRDNVDEQGRFNQEIQEGIGHTNSLGSMIRNTVAAYASMRTVGSAINLSDTMTQTTARLGLIVDDGGSVEELQDKIFASAQNARGSYMATADAVSRLGMQASQAFSSNDELIAFTELLNKSFVNAGTSAQGVDSVMLQLTQSMAAGKLQGEELNAVLDNAAPIVQNIQRYLEEVQGIDAGNIKELASEGVITADIVKNAMFYAADDINAKFESMPMTWGQTWQSMQNTALVAFQPVLLRLNDLANSGAFQSFVNGAAEAMAVLAGILVDICEMAAMAGTFMADNWSVISPIVYGVIGALAVYMAYLGIMKAVELAGIAVKGAMAVAEFIHVAALAAQTGATISATAAQQGLNGAMYACPVVWIIVLIIALIAIIFAVCSAIAKMTGVANSGFGVMTGGVNVVIQFFKNLGLSVANIALGIWEALGACAHNLQAAFHNAICSVQSWFYDLLATGLSVIEGICKALNKLPFVDIDYSGISSAADDYAAKAAEAAGNKEEYRNVGDAFSEGFSTFETFQDGWVSEAFDAGASWGDGIAESVGDFSLKDMLGGTDIPNPDDYVSGFGDVMADSGVSDNLGSIAGDTGSIKDSMDIAQEDLKYLRDIAEQEAVNRYTLAEVRIEQTNHNNIGSSMDLDGVLSGLTDVVNEAVDSITEGVHA